MVRAFEERNYVHLSKMFLVGRGNGGRPISSLAGEHRRFCSMRALRGRICISVKMLLKEINNERNLRRWVALRRKQMIYNANKWRSKLFLGQKLVIWLFALYAATMTTNFLALKTLIRDNKTRIFLFGWEINCQIICRARESRRVRGE